MASLVKTVMVIDQTGKAVTTVSFPRHSCSSTQRTYTNNPQQSKQLIDVFKGAKSAYRERKAEIVAGRQYELEEKRARRAHKAQTIDDRSVASSRRHPTSKHSSRRPEAERHHTTDSVRTRTSPRSRLSPRSYSYDVDGNPMPRHELARRHTDRSSNFSPPATPTRALTTPATADEIDMDLAYGDIPPPLPVARTDEEAEMNSLVEKVRKLLEEAECLQYTASQTIANLKKNPDAMAAVGLTLAEISSLATKLSPGVLMALKGSAPAVFALLASPQFLIAGGVAVGVTVIAIGGLKVVQSIRAKNAAAKEDPGMDELLEIGSDVNRIDSWRRGIAEFEEQSVGTSVDGEFITPTAAAMSNLELSESGIEKLSKGGEKRKKKEKKESSSKSVSSKDSKSGGKDKKDKKEKKEKKPSQLRLMFRGESA